MDGSTAGRSDHIVRVLVPRRERQRTHGRRDIRNLARMLGRVHALRRDGHLDARHVREPGRGEELLLLVVQKALEVEPHVAGRGTIIERI